MSNFEDVCDHGVVPGGFLRIKQVLELVPVSRSTIWTWIKNGTFPSPIKLAPKCTVWRSDDILLYLKDGGWTHAA